MDVDLLAAEPFYAIGDPPCALPGEKRRELDAEPRIHLALLRETVVVVRLREVDERAELLAPRDCAWKIPFEGTAVVGLEYFGVRPVKVCHGEQVVGELKVPAKPLKHEDRVGILLPDARDDVLPRLERNHVPGVAPEAVDSVAAPEEEDVRHVGAELGVRVVELNKIGPLDAPRARRVESAVRLAAEPVWMVRLKRRRPASVVRRKVDEQKPVARMHRVDELPELVERSRELVELRHRGIDREKIGRGKRAAVFAHYGVRRRDGERRKRLDDAEAHPVHDVVETPRNFAERAELPREDSVYRIVRPRFRALDLDMEVASLGPFWDVRPLGEEARLARKYADFVKKDVGLENPRFRLRERNVGPRPGKRRLAALRLGYDFAPANAGATDVRAERGSALPRSIESERHGKYVAAPLEKKRFRSRSLGHHAAILYQNTTVRGWKFICLAF